MLQDLLLGSLGTTEFGFRHAQTLKNPVPNVPLKIATLSHSAFSVRAGTRPILGPGVGTRREPFCRRASQAWSGVGGRSLLSMTATARHAAKANDRSIATRKSRTA